MRFGKEIYLGTTRTIRKFLLLPLEINGETRWLEYATIKQKMYFYGWESVEFIDEEVKK